VFGPGGEEGGGAGVYVTRMGLFPNGLVPVYSYGLYCRKIYSMATSIPPAVPPQVRQLATDLADAKPMRRGSLSERTIKCSKPGCACARDPKARHGPYYSLTHAVKGKTRSRFLTAEEAGLAQQQIEAGRKFRADVDAYWEVCEQWADAQLADLSASPGEAKKGGSKRTSKTKSSRKSKRS
jgi:hypothetical protein